MKFAATLVMALGLQAFAAPAVQIDARTTEQDVAKREPIGSVEGAALQAALTTIIAVGGLAALKEWGHPKTSRRDLEGLEAPSELELRNAVQEIAERDPKLGAVAGAALQAALTSSIAVGGLAALNKWGHEKTSRRDEAETEASKPILLAVDPVTLGLDLSSLGLQKRADGSDPVILLSLDPASLGLDKRDPKISENWGKLIAGVSGAAATLIGSAIVNGQIQF